jgi:hypothetical protein
MSMLDQSKLLKLLARARRLACEYYRLGYRNLPRIVRLAKPVFSGLRNWSPSECARALKRPRAHGQVPSGCPTNVGFLDRTMDRSKLAA